MNWRDFRKSSSRISSFPHNTSYGSAFTAQYREEIIDRRTEIDEPVLFRLLLFGLKYPFILADQLPVWKFFLLTTRSERTMGADGSTEANRS